jgi:Dihydroxyacid dehydratase/phosphogluconate dehydratase
VTDKKDLRIKSHVYDGIVKAPNRAMMRATGMQDDDFKKPIVGVISTWAENTPCNMHLGELGGKAKEGVKTAGGWPVQFGTITVSDGISMGNPGDAVFITIT